MEWKTVERPGYFGKKRDYLFSSWDSLYGKDRWRIAWQWDSQTKKSSDFGVQEIQQNSPAQKNCRHSKALAKSQQFSVPRNESISGIIEKPEALQIYEDAYYEFLKSRKDILDWLVHEASDVYDTAISNIESKLDYSKQETLNTHIQDIAIRRSVLRLGKQFKGNMPLEVRSRDKEGWKLSPCNVPFHLPEMILKEEIKDYPEKGLWWERLGIPDSVEAFYQRNKVLQVNCSNS